MLMYVCDCMFFHLSLKAYVRTLSLKVLLLTLNAFMTCITYMYSVRAMIGQYVACWCLYVTASSFSHSPSISRSPPPRHSPFFLTLNSPPPPPPYLSLPTYASLHTCVHVAPSLPPSSIQYTILHTAGNNLC